MRPPAGEWRVLFCLEPPDFTHAPPGSTVLGQPNTDREIAAPEADPPTRTSPGTPPASPAPAPARPRSGSAALAPSPDNTAPSFAIHTGSRPVPAKMEKSGIVWVSPGEWNSRHPAGNCTAIPAAPAAASGSSSGTRTFVRTPPASSLENAPPAPGRPRSGRRTPSARNRPCTPAGTQNAIRRTCLIMNRNPAAFCDIVPVTFPGGV